MGMVHDDIYDHLLNVMLTYHNGFRRSYAEIQAAAPQSQQYTSAELRSFLQKCLTLAHHVEMHHSFEETYLFPRLATKIPSFGRNEAHVKEHAAMHVDLDAFKDYCQEVVSSLDLEEGILIPHEVKMPVKKVEYNLEQMTRLIRNLEDTLFPHLESEEKSIHAENLRKVGFTAEELKMLPI